MFCKNKKKNLYYFIQCQLEFWRFTDSGSVLCFVTVLTGFFISNLLGVGPLAVSQGYKSALL